MWGRGASLHRYIGRVYGVGYPETLSMTWGKAGVTLGAAEAERLRVTAA